MASRFPFKSAVFIDESGQITALGQAVGDHGGSSRRPLRLQVCARRDGSAQDTTIATIEFSRAEAFAFSEWLDAVVTQLPPK